MILCSKSVQSTTHALKLAVLRTRALHCVRRDRFGLGVVMGGHGMSTCRQLLGSCNDRDFNPRIPMLQTGHSTTPVRGLQSLHLWHTPT